MLLKKKKVTNGTRHQIILKKFLLSKKSRLLKNLIKYKKTSSGRSFSTGHISVNHKGGGKKQSFRCNSVSINYNFSIAITTLYNPKTSAFYGLYYNFLNKQFGYSIFTAQTFPGSLLYSYFQYPQLFLSCLVAIEDVPTGSLIHSILRNGKIIYIKSAGCYGVLLQKTNHYYKIKMPSGVIKTFFNGFFCVLGCISNEQHNQTVLGKAGKSRLKNRRPIVRGVAMNPVDHPHGGQTSGGIPSVTPWGLPTKGKPTRNNKLKLF
jgi:large subunit ribosomal protein L2